MTDDDKALVERLRSRAKWLEPELDVLDENEVLAAADRIEAQAAEIDRLRKELKSEQKSTDNALDNYDAGVRRIEAQAGEIERLRKAGNLLYEVAYHGDECPMNTTGALCNCGVEQAEQAWRLARAGKAEQ